MIALAAPAALLGAAPGLPVRLVGAAVVVTFMGSYVLFRDWERFGPLLLKHPALLAADTLLGALLLVTAGPQSTLGYVSVCTPLLAGLAYSWRGAAFFACLQSLVLLAVRGDVLLLMRPLRHHGRARRHPAQPSAAVRRGRPGPRRGPGTPHRGPGRRDRTGPARPRDARLRQPAPCTASPSPPTPSPPAPTRPRSTNGPHSSPARPAGPRPNPANSSPTSGASRTAGPGRPHVDLASELTNRVHDFNTRWEASGIATAYRSEGDGTPPVVPYPMARQLLSIAAEAMENAGRHAHPTRIDVTAGVHAGLLRISVRDDGRGLPPGTTLDTLRGTGHFGLVGMVERAAGVGARLRIGRGGAARGTEVRLEIPLGATR